MYLVGMMGQNMIYNIIGTGLYFYFQSVIFIPAMAISIFMAVARVWDAINDPMMGTFVDRTNTKWGKCRPYLLFSPAVIMVITILTFCNGMYSSANTPGKNALIVGWAAVSYILWGMCYTVGDIPLWGVTSRMTEVEKDRASILSLARIAAGLGGGVVLLTINPLSQALGQKLESAAGSALKGQQMGFIIVAVILTVIGCGMFQMTGVFVRERVPSAEQKFGFKENFKIMWGNKPFRNQLISGVLRSPIQILLSVAMTLMSYYYGNYFGDYMLYMIVIAASVLGSTMVTANQCADYIGNYIIIQNYTDFRQIFMDFLPGAQSTLVPNVDAAAAYDFWIPRGTIVTTLTVAIGVGMVPAMAIFPLLRKKFSLKQIYIGSALFGFAVHGLCYVILAQDVTKINIFILWIFLFLMGLPLGIYNVITYALIADSIDYLEWKTGERQEGVCFAFQTFLSKVNAAIATFVFGQLLAQTDFKAVDKSLVDNAGRQIFFEQSGSTQKMLLALVTIVPAVGFILTIIPMFFNKYTGKVKAQAQAELEAKREKLMESEEA
jgi:Na+/melibiose symporter-like transporter